MKKCNHEWRQKIEKWGTPDGFYCIRCLEHTYLYTDRPFWKREVQNIVGERMKFGDKLFLLLYGTFGFMLILLAINCIW